jgi:hypothetical protein
MSGTNQHEALRRLTTKASQILVMTEAQIPIAFGRGWNLSAYLPKLSTAWSQASRCLIAILNAFRLTSTTTPASSTDTGANELPEPTIPLRDPMNLLLPAYETMWHAVLRCFLEIRCLGADNGPQWSMILTEYLEALEGADNQYGAFQNHPAPVSSPSTSLRKLYISTLPHDMCTVSSVYTGSN